MIGGISGVGTASGVSAYYGINLYQKTANSAGQNRTAQAQDVQKASGVQYARRAEALETPVEPVRPVKAVSSNETSAANLGLPIREGVDPAEMAVRMRIQYVDPAADAAAAQAAADKLGGAPVQESKSAQEVAEEGKCQTCEERKYQDGSDDMGVSFQTPTRIDPSQVASAVMGHEMEHVTREQAKAQREDRQVVSQSVTLHTDICPECGKVYISGGTTRTTTKANPEPEQPDAIQQALDQQKQRVPFSAVA